jgi:spore maturation protein CgeB
MLDESVIRKYVLDASTEAVLRSAVDLPTERTARGQATLAFGGVRLHSAVDPAAEAAMLLEPMHGELTSALKRNESGPLYCVIFGAGLGYLIRAVSDYIEFQNPSAKIHILCVEANPEIARKALETCVWEPCPYPVTWLVGSVRSDTIRRYAPDGARQLLALGGGYRQSREVYDSIINDLSHTARAERPMRILIPTPLYGGSYPIARHCADAFCELGHQVEVLDLADHYASFKRAEGISSNKKHGKTLQGLLTTYLAEMIAARALDWRADLLWAVAQTPLTPTALAELKQEGVHTAFWFVEDYRVFPYWQDLAPHFDAFFTIQRGAFHDELKSRGLRHVFYLPMAANPRVHYPVSMSDEDRRRFGSDVSFLGAGYYNRQLFFARYPLPGLKIWGNDWPSDCAAASLIQEGGRRISTEDTAKIYTAAKVNLNLHSSTHHAGLNPDGDFVNPRTFEIAACGGFQIVDWRSELEGLFDVPQELAVVRRAEDIPQQVKFYLEHEDVRQAMAERARQRVLSEHTYVHRLASALNLLEQRLPRLAQRKRGPNYVSSLKQAAADDPELLEFLNQFPDDAEVNLDDIVARIKLGDGDLSQPEAIFLLMKEFRDWGREKGVIQ